MQYYFIANIKISDFTEYQKYLENSGEVFKKYNGKYLVVDGSPEILEGAWDYTRVVLIQFDSKEDFDAWYHSEAYQEILKYRLNAAECNTILAKGLEA